MSSNETKVAWSLAAELGEGGSSCGLVIIIDIKKQRIHQFGDSGDQLEAKLGRAEQVGFVFPSQRGGFVAELTTSGLYNFEEHSGAFELIAEVRPTAPTDLTTK